MTTDVSGPTEAELEAAYVVNEMLSLATFKSRSPYQVAPDGIDHKRVRALLIEDLTRASWRSRGRHE